jgi:hypothetical protein
MDPASKIDWLDLFARGDSIWNWRYHGKEAIQATSMDKRGRSRTQIQRATKAPRPKDCALTQENGGCYQAKGFQLGNLFGLTLVGEHVSALWRGYRKCDRPRLINNILVTG